MHNADMYAREFEVPVDLTDDTPGAGAPGPRLSTKDAVMLAGLDGKSARRMATAALMARMSDKEVWRALVDAANNVATLAMEAGNYAVGQRAVEQQKALTRELRRRTEGRR